MRTDGEIAEDRQHGRWVRVPAEDADWGFSRRAVPVGLRETVDMGALVAAGPSSCSSSIRASAGLV